MEGDGDGKRQSWTWWLSSGMVLSIWFIGTCMTFLNRNRGRTTRRTCYHILPQYKGCFRKTDPETGRISITVEGQDMSQALRGCLCPESIQTFKINLEMSTLTRTDRTTCGGPRKVTAINQTRSKRETDSVTRIPGHFSQWRRKA